MLSASYNPRHVNHFNPFEKMFIGHLLGCTFSLVAMAAMALALYQYFAACGLAALVVHYVMPLLVFATYIVVVTFLHHCDVDTPWYSDDRWDFVRGQLSTVDRDYGVIHHLIHSIDDSS